MEDTERAKLLAEKLREMIREGNFDILWFFNISYSPVPGLELQKVFYYLFQNCENGIEENF